MPHRSCAHPSAGGRHSSIATWPKHLDCWLPANACRSGGCGRPRAPMRCAANSVRWVCIASYTLPNTARVETYSTESVGVVS
jgi:hypothetical protein